MCGIVGYIGKQEAAPILLEGLKALEYRGYDSAGIAVFSKKREILALKAVGKVASLEEKILSQKKPLSGGLGIAHTRWATHGGVCEKNAHPHSDCEKEIWLAHNGIVENYAELRKALIKKGHVFKSETDTEVIGHLIEEEQKRGGAFEEAVRRALKKIRGTYGLAIFNAKEPEKLIAARNFSPLLVGLGKDEYFIASDPSAVIRHTRDVIYLRDGEIAILSRGGFRIINLDKELVHHAP
ncbi:TPA: glutamine--fructose-6-phosphate aminotransferase, partial [Candidatus Azambacteria bacterium]|nr:glutamine--fructose-6-phosphate aminotransferase [Candidatus Azambacteria bacterium]